MKRRICNYLIAILALTSLQIIPSVISVSNAATETATSTDGTTASACNQDVGTPDSVTVVRIGNDCIITFVGSSTWNIPAGITSLRYLIVGGGGAGGAAGGNDGSGGGGAGGFLTGSINNPPATNSTVVVGAGGSSTSASAYYHNPANYNGGDSYISGTGITTITAKGGGSGSSESAITRVASNGGSGGGGGGYSGTSGTSNASGQGNDGGSTSRPGDGGGGGAGAKGGNGNSSSSDGTPRRAGGIGRLSDISGVNKYYAGGGGASGDARNSDGTAGGAGGLGGGGNGASATTGAAPTDGEPNTGGGGGGAAGTNPVGSVQPTGRGGSGVVIFRYTLNTNCSSVSDNLSQPGYVIEKFISVGSCTWNKPAGVTSADVLVVGGGGGGGRAANGSIVLGNEAGGGGAGGFKESIGVTLNSDSYSIVVGAGGEANANGVGSSAFDISVSGGGRGAYAIHVFTTSSGSGNVGGNGGSGGGGMHNQTAGGTGIAGEGYAGGTPSSGSQGGGGGGAGEAGNTDGAAFGGDGKTSQITGTTYAGGGSGTLGSGGTPEGGAGGGGVSASFNTLSVDGANNGAENTGSGGAGGFTNNGTKNAGSGGSGIVVIRYRLESSSFDSALSLNGSNQYASASSAQVIPTATSSTFSVEAWIKQPASRSNGTLYQVVSQGNLSAQFYLKIFNGSLIFSRTGYLAENTCTVGIPTEQWTHVAVVVGNSSQFCYINGAPAGSFTQSSSTAIGTKFAVGQYAPSGGEYFLGEIDEVKIWNTSRSQSEIRSDLKTYGGTLASGLVAYYDFNELSNTTVINRSSGGSSDLNLTTTGSPTISSTSIFETTTVQAYTVVKFMRNYLVATGGYKFPDTSTTIQYLIVGGGGGGGGGYNGGGGGAGGFRESVTVVNTTSPVSVVVGQGGNGAVIGNGPSNGETSTIFGISSTGGGKGATEQQQMSGPYSGTSPDGTPNSGGSGGGGGHGASSVAIWATNLSGAPGNAGGYSQVEGFAGGSGNSNSSNPCCAALAGGGGGGAGGAGGNASANGLSGTPGQGGIGKVSYITGNALSLAGGGGGAGRYGDNAGAIIRGASASFGGGAGAQNTTAEQSATFNGVSGTANTGGGGGGGGAILGDAKGGNGGSGLIVVRYITSKPTIITQPRNETSTVGAYETFTITTSAAPAPLTKSVQWQYSNDTITGTTGWENMPVGTGITTDTFTTPVILAEMNKVRFRAIVTFSDTSTLSIVETSTSVILTVNPAIMFQSDTTTITRKYGDSQTVRTITYSGGTTSSGAVGTSTSHTVNTPYGALANGKIYVDTTTTTAKFFVDTGTPVGTYYDTITVTDYKGAVSSYIQKVIVNPADTLTVQADTLTAITYNPAGMTINATASYSGFVASDTATAVTFTFSEEAQDLVGNPTNAGTYTITPSALTLANGVSTSNYVNIVYRNSTFVINKATQDTLTIASRVAPYNGGTSTMKLTTAGGSDTGTVTYSIAPGGTASGCAVNSNELSYTSTGTCLVVATKAATINYLIAYSETATITLSAFVSNQQVQTQSVHTQLPINGANSLETATVTAALLTITGVTNSGGGSYAIAGTGFTNVSVVRIGGTDLVLNGNYTVTSTTAISITNASGLVGPLFIYLSDGQQAVRFEFPN